MSMNLYIEVDGSTLELRQTPTAITYMCLTSDVGCSFEVTGKAAKRALRCYIEWAKGSLNGVWHDAEALDYAREQLNEHLADLTLALERGKKFVAYTL